MAIGILGGGTKGSWHQLLAETSITGTGNKSLSDDVSKYTALVFLINNGTEWKPYLIPQAVLSGNTFDVSWNATDSVTWYVVLTVTFSGTTMRVEKFQKSGFNTVKAIVYGLI